jgi:NAD(P)-dependent dehydrogenase (short-subunit alcohol dehydrogenase family)
MNIFDQFSLQGKTALVTGSARGIGRAIAEGFVAAGAKLWLTDVLEAEGAQVAQQLGTRFVKADLTNSAEIQALAAQIAAAEIKLDVLVNNAGLDRVILLDNLDMNSFDEVWKVNARGPVELTSLLLPLLRKAPGASIINVTSIHSFVPHPGNLPYNMAKAALAMFTKSMAQELSPEGIRINNLAPGAVETAMNRDVLADVGYDNFNQWIPIGRVADTSDMVGPALFLASDASRYVTGTTILADGGYLQNLVRYRLDSVTGLSTSHRA